MNALLIIFSSVSTGSTGEWLTKLGRRQSPGGRLGLRPGAAGRPDGEQRGWADERHVENHERRLRLVSQKPLLE